MDALRPMPPNRAAKLAVWSRFVLAAAALAIVPPVSVAADYVQTAALFRSGKYAECVQSAAEAIAEEDYSENFRVLKLRAEMELGRYGDALATLDEALKRFPHSLELRWLGREVCRFNNHPQRAKKLEEELANLARQSSWRYTDALNQVVLGRFFLSQGMDPKKVLDGQFGEAKKQRPTLAEPHLASGELALDKDDYALAAEAFAQAIKNDAGNPDAHYGLARAFAPSEPDKAEAAIKSALALNPLHVPSLLFLAENHIDAENYAEAEAALQQVFSVNPHHPRAAAFRAVLAHLANEPDSEERHRQAALRHWPANPEVDYLIGRKLSQKYRFAEGAKYQRRSLALDPTYLPAKMQLAQDLLRLGQEEEGWKLVQECHQEDGYNVVAYNLVTLQENLARFRTLEEDGIVLRMDAREADIYGRRVLDLLKTARAELCAKYDVQLAQPIVVEMFPRQQDFAIRTFGLPGGAGFLGVCFGTVITANSPASQGDSPACWESTLWHEFCHVVTLQKTHNKMPRWLSEGISVYEERQKDPAWGQSMNARYRQMILGGELTPVSELSGAFLNPKTPLHLQFAYYESSLVVEYLLEKHGLEALKRILVDLGVGMPIQEALTRHVASAEALDEDFAKYAQQKAGELAPQADWSEPELPRQASSEVIAAWLKDHPQNYAGLSRLAAQLIAEGKWEAAKEPLGKMTELYPRDGSSDGPYAMLSRVYRELGENQKEREVLQKLADLSDDNVEALARLTELAAEQKDWELTRKYALRWLGVNPLQPAPHRRAAAAARELGDDALAMESCQALLLLDPVDPAELHFRLAQTLKRRGDLRAARRHVLLALEETPRYRAAHRLLLEIVREMAPAGRAELPAKSEGSAPAKEDAP
jgi:tetratricopeptide (TPR) repeat protein